MRVTDCPECIRFSQTAGRTDKFHQAAQNIAIQEDIDLEAYVVGFLIEFHRAGHPAKLFKAFGVAHD